MTRGYYAVLASVSRSYSPLEGRLVTCYSPVRRFTQVLLPFLARLACVRHAASVDSEPGSNSRLKPDVVSLRRRSNGDRPFPHSPVSRQGVQGTLLVRMIKPNLIHSHNWHVQPNCQRSVRAFRLSGALLDRGPDCYAKVSSNLMRMAKTALFSTLGRFCANFLKLSNFLLYVNHLFSSHLYPVEVSRRRCQRSSPDAMSRNGSH